MAAGSSIQRANSLSVTPTPPFAAEYLHRRFSTPSPYTGGSSSTGQPAALPIDPATQANNQAHDPVVAPANRKHEYNLMSRGRKYALITVMSRASNSQESPLLYSGERLEGFIQVSPGDLGGMRSMDVVLQMFDSDPIIPSGESKSVMLPQNVDSSHLSDGHYHWPFSIVPPTIVVSSPNSPSAESSLGPGHISSHGRGRDLKHQLVVTIYRRGRLNRNVGVTQQIRYVPPPDPSMPSCPSPSAIEAPHDFPVNSDWEPQEYPGVLVKGSFYGKSIEVVCKLIIPNSYPLGGPIPLGLVMTSEDIRAINLVAVPQAQIIDVRLLRVIAFGQVNCPFTVAGLTTFHRTDWVANAQWELEDQPTQLPPDEEHARSRWCIKFKGELHQEKKFELTKSFRTRDYSVMYFVCLFPFRVSNFRPVGGLKKKELFMGEISLQKPCGPPAETPVLH